MDLGTAFAAACARAPGKVAVVDGDKRLTYAGWYETILRVAGGLAGMGLRRGDALVCVAGNHLETATLYWACQMLGAVFAPFNWRAAADEVAYVLTDADAQLVACDAGGGAAVEAATSAGIPSDRLIALDDEVGEGVAYASLLNAGSRRRLRSS